MFKSIYDKIALDRDYSVRTWDILVRERMLGGTFYDVIQNAFHDEKNGAGEYILLKDRRPSVQTGLIRTLVDDSVSMLFSEGHFPDINVEDKDLLVILADLVKTTRLNSAMIDAAVKGSTGSVCIWMRILRGKVFFEALSTAFLTPEFDANDPDTLVGMSERRKVDGASLIAAGYAGIETGKTYWFRREWDADSETWYKPAEVVAAKDKDFSWAIDKKASVKHGLGFVPMVWVRNLPGGNGIDGAPTMTISAINTVIEADYQLSQVGRGLKYSSDPTLIIREPAVDSDGRIVKSPNQAIVVSKDGDGKLLEINGTAAGVVIEYVKHLRDVALESMHGNRGNPDKMSAAKSGRALEIMYQPLIWLADKLRISYGEGAILDLIQMVIRASQGREIIIAGKKYSKLNPDGKNISLRWPHWFPSTFEDKLNDVNALVMATTSPRALISQETAIKSLSETYEIEDVLEEISKINGQTPIPDGNKPSSPSKAGDNSSA